MPSSPDTRQLARHGAAGPSLHITRATSTRLSALLATVALAWTGCASSSSEHGGPRETAQAASTRTAEPAADTPAAASPGADTPATAPATPAPAPAPEPAPTTAEATPAAARPACTRQTFATPLPLAEASGAVYLPHPEKPVILLAGDSGTRGAFIELDPETGAVLASGKLPLGRGASDDLEGLTAIGDTIYGLTSGGWMRHWRRRPDRPAARRYELVRGPYPVATASDDGLVCGSARDTNCGRNYEGLCLRDPPDPAAACAGFAVSKADGALYCLTLEDDGSVRAHAGDRIAVAPPETLTGCDFAPPGREPAADLLWVGSNAFGANRVFTVSGWQTPARARVAMVGVLGLGFGEAMALGPAGAVYRFSDTASARSLADKYRCE
jgi:hypothetical protein